MPTHLSTKYLLTALGVLTSLALLSPLYFWPSVYLPFSSPTLIGFLFFVELALPVYLILAARKKHPFAILREPIILTLSLLVLVLILTSFIGLDPLNSLFGTLQRPVSTLVWIHGWFFVLFVIELLQAPIWKTRLTTTLIAMATLVAMYTLGEGWLWPTFVSFEGRTASLLGGPGYLAAFLMLPTFLSFSLATQSKHYGHLFSLAGAIMTLAIILTATRGALLGLIAGGLILVEMLVLTKTPITKKKTFTIGASIILAIIVSVLFASATTSNSIWNRFTDINDENISVRLIYWDWAIDDWLEHPLLGVGPQNFYTVADSHFTEDLYEVTSVWPDKPHNTFLERLVTTGLVGTLAWLAILFFLIKSLWEQKDRSSAYILAGLCAYLVQGLFFFDGISDTIVFLFTIALLSKHKKDSLVERRVTPILFGALGIVLTVAGVILLVLPLRAQVIAAGQGELYDGRIIDDTLMAKTAFIRATESEEHSLQAANEAITAYERTVALHPLRQAAWNDLGQLYFFKATLEGTYVEEAGLTALGRAAELAPGRREAAYIYSLILQYHESLVPAQ